MVVVEIEDKVANNKRGPPTGQINPARSSVTQKAARLPVSLSPGIL